MSQYGSLDELQAELRADDADTPVNAIGINGAGFAGGNDFLVQQGDIPWLQDDAQTDVWNAWKVTYRDVVILDRFGRPYGVFNLTEHDLSAPADYAALKQMLLDAAAED